MGSKSGIFKKIFFYLLGIYFTAVAIALSKMTPLGLSPNSTLPNELSLITGISLGTVTTLCFSSYVIIQWILLGKNFRKINFFQIVLSIIYGFFVNSAMDVVHAIVPVPETYIMQLSYIIISGFILGIGINIYLVPKFMSLPVEGLAQAVTDRFKVSFATSKNICDIIIVASSIILSFVYFGELNGIREGTLILAILVGRAVKWTGGITKPIERFING